MIYWYMAAIKTRMRYASGFCFYVGVKFFYLLISVTSTKKYNCVGTGGGCKKTDCGSFGEQAEGVILQNGSSLVLLKDNGFRLLK